VVPDLVDIDLPRDFDAPGVARDAVARFDYLLGPQRAQDVRLLTSELVTNAVKYGGDGDLRLHLTLNGGRLRVEIVDHGSGFDAEETVAARDRDDLELVGGWGLPIVEALAEEWGSYEGPTHVWFEFSVEPERDDPTR
jgi:anti-sigma regulatory factor (Ser/Thr protein kinase)